MQTDVTEKIVGKIKVLSAEQKEKVLEFVENLTAKKNSVADLARAFEGYSRRRIR